MISTQPTLCLTTAPSRSLGPELHLVSSYGKVTLSTEGRNALWGQMAHGKPTHWTGVLRKETEYQVWWAHLTQSLPKGTVLHK